MFARMAEPISLRCHCGAVRGSTRPVSESSGTRVVCYCDDCRAYLHYLKRPELLDAAGGSDIFQMAPGDLVLTEGESEVRCMRLSSRGMHRFYAGCCRTPIGNTLGPRLPFIGVLHAFMELTPQQRDARLGPASGIMAQFATSASVLPGSHPKMPLRLILNATQRMLVWSLTGRARSPLFPGGRPIAAPTVLSSAEREALRDLPARAVA